MSIVQHLNRFRYKTSAAKDLNWPVVRAVNVGSFRDGPPDFDLVKKLTSELCDAKLDTLPNASPLEVVQLAALLQVLLQFQLHSQQVLKDQLAQKQNTESVNKMASQQIATLEARISALQRKVDDAHAERAAVQGTVHSLERTLVEANARASGLQRELDAERKVNQELLKIAAVAAAGSKGKCSARSQQAGEVCSRHSPAHRPHRRDASRANGGSDAAYRRHDHHPHPSDAVAVAADDDAVRGGETDDEDEGTAASATSYEHSIAQGRVTAEAAAAAASQRQRQRYSSRGRAQQRGGGPPHAQVPTAPLPASYVDWQSLAMLMAARPLSGSVSPPPIPATPAHADLPVAPAAHQAKSEVPVPRPSVPAATAALGDDPPPPPPQDLVPMKALEETLSRFSTTLRKELDEHKAESAGRADAGFKRVEQLLSTRIEHLNAKQTEVLDRVGSVEERVGALGAELRSTKEAHQKDVSALTTSVAELRKAALPPLAIAALSRDPEFGPNVRSSSPSPLVSASRHGTPHHFAAAPAAGSSDAAAVSLQAVAKNAATAAATTSAAAAAVPTPGTASRAGSEESNLSSNRDNPRGGGGDDANAPADAEKATTRGGAAPTTPSGAAAGPTGAAPASGVGASSSNNYSRLDQSSIMHDSSINADASRTLPRKESELARAQRELQELLAEEEAAEEEKKRRRSLDVSAASSALD